MLVRAFLDDTKQRNGGAIDQLAVELVVVVRHRQPAALLEFGGQVGRWRPAGPGCRARTSAGRGRGLRHFANRLAQAFSGVSQNAQAFVLSVLQNMAGQFELKLDRDQHLTDAIVQFAGNPVIVLLPAG